MNQSGIAKSKLLTIPQVGERLNLSRSSIYRLMGTGDLIPIKIGKSVRFVEADVNAFILSLVQKR